MSQHAQSGSAAFDAGAGRQQAVRHRTAIQHEVVRLLDDLAPPTVPARRAPAPLAVKAYRWPNRCILQGESHAISITWFAGARDDESLGELLVMWWRGTVTLPGSGQRVHEEAVPVAQFVLHPETSSGGWAWCAATPGAAELSTAELAAYCRNLLEPTDVGAAATAAAAAALGAGPDLSAEAAPKRQRPQLGRA